jgi:two-component system nitrate/nitrite sensor histidine kinase NarX
MWHDPARVRRARGIGSVSIRQATPDSSMETNPRFAAPAAPVPAAPGSGILAEITAGLASGNDLHELLARFLRPLIDLAGAQAGAVRVLDDDGRRMHLMASLGLPPAVLEAERAVDGDCGACGVALHGRPAWAHDLSACARRSDGAYFGSGCQRILAVPLSHRGRTLGIYNLFYETSATPAPEVTAMLESVGALLGLALQNARLEREHLRAALDGERQAIAAEVHDSIGQSLAFVKMRLPLLQDAMRGDDLARAERYFDDVRSAVGQAHASLRAVLTHMRAPMDPRGLAQALAAGAETFRERGTVQLEVINALPELRLPVLQEEQVFHIVQEALANVTRHAAARHAWVRLERDGDALQVVIEDDGSGLRADAREGSSHYGLTIMHERARRLGGALELGPRPGGGTRVRLRFPLPAPGHAPTPAEAALTEGLH